LVVTGPNDSDTADAETVEVPLKIGKGGYQYIGLFRPEAPGTYTAEVLVDGHSQMTIDFVVFEAGNGNANAHGQAQNKELRKKDKATGKPAADVSPPKDEKPHGKPADNGPTEPGGGDNNKGNGKAKGKDKDKGNGKEK
jgi:hypothetical protein